MRFILALLLTAAICFLAGLRLEWWSIALVAFFVALLIPQRIAGAFLSGFLGVFIMWSVLAVWIDSKNGNSLSQKMAEIFKLGGSSILLILATALIGGLVGGFAAMAGSSLRPVPRIRRY